MKKIYFNKFLDSLDVEEFKNFFMTHNNSEVFTAYDINYDQLRKILNTYNIPLKSRKQSAQIAMQTSLKRYGVSSPTKLESSKLKAKQTKLEKYGDSNYTNATKAKQTKLEKYGDPTFNNSKKAKQTIIDKYGSIENFNKIKLDNCVKTCTEKYGVSYAIGSDVVKNKIRNTLSEKYGVENISQVDDVKEKKKQTCLDKFGVEYSFQAEQVKNKIKETVREKYGVDYAVQSDEIKNKIKATNLLHLGVEYPTQSAEVKEKCKQTTREHYGVKYITQSNEIKNKIKSTVIQKYGVPYFCMSNKYREYSSNNSGPNIAFANLLDKNGLLYSDIPTDDSNYYSKEFIIDNKSFDFKIGNILIEINPYATHNSTWGIFSNQGLDRRYHIDKSQLALKNGYKCINIWDWDDQDKIISLLKQREKIYARKCTIKEVSKNDAKIFIDTYHLQNYAKDTVRIGLYYNNELVSIMTFGKPRYNKKYDYELIRYCSSKIVVGGAEKLFKYFINNYNPLSIISYCDLSKFNGEIYLKLGFIKQNNNLEPSKHWYNPKTKQHITDNLLRQRGFDQLFHTDYGKGTSNEELMRQYNFVEIFDCGQAIYTLSI